MNRLITFLTILMAIGLMTSYAWAGDSQSGMNHSVSYQNLSNAAFFGYTDLNAGSEHNGAINNRAAVEKQAKNIKTAETTYEGLSSAQFFGYENPAPVKAKTVNRMEQIAKGEISHPVMMNNAETDYNALAPADFFYGFPNTNINRLGCEKC